VDGKVIGDIKCPPTGGWWSFVGMPITMGPLSKGPHLLLIKSNGININLEKEFAESEVDKLEILKEKIYFALKQVYEKSKQEVGSKVRESYSDDLLIKLKDLNSALDTLSKEVSEL
jgi:hypothetical protein